MKVFYASCDRQWYDNYAYLFLKDLPGIIQQRISKFKNWQDACRSLVGILLLKVALKENNIDNDLVNLKYNEYGRPFICEDFDFNITHSGSYAVCVIKNGCRVGVDLERIRPINLDHFQSQFSKDEWLKIIEAEQKIAEFYHYWTLKEAVVKADGRGLKIPLESVIVNGEFVKVQNKLWYYHTIDLLPGYACHVVCEAPFTFQPQSKHVHLLYDNELKTIKEIVWRKKK